MRSGNVRLRVCAFAHLLGGDRYELLSGVAQIQ